MAKKKKVEPEKEKLRESWELENLRSNLRGIREVTPDAVEDKWACRLFDLADEAIGRIALLEEEADCQKKKLDEVERQVEAKIEEIEALQEKLDEYDTEVADAARKVIKLVPSVLGHEDLNEHLETFDLRRAVEDLKIVL
jgi:phage shock protein A